MKEMDKADSFTTTTPDGKIIAETNNGVWEKKEQLKKKENKQ